MLQAGLMMDRPLLISDVIEHAAGQFGDTAIVSREADGNVFRYGHLQCRERTMKLANAPAAGGLGASTSIGSLALNHHQPCRRSSRDVRSGFRVSSRENRSALPGRSPLDLRVICLSPRDTILPVVPMFHVNGTQIA